MVSNRHPVKECITQLQLAREQDVTVNRVHLTSSPAKQWSPCPSWPHMAGRMLPFTSRAWWWGNWEHMYRLPRTRATRILILLTLTHVLPSNHTLNGICLFHKNPSYLHFPSATQRLYSFPLFSPIPPASSVLTTGSVWPTGISLLLHWTPANLFGCEDQRGAEGTFHYYSTTTNLKTQVSFTFYFCISQLISPAYLIFPLNTCPKAQQCRFVRASHCIWKLSEVDLPLFFSSSPYTHST